MSWREREFSHESDAYYRSLDQATDSGSVEAIAGYHVEDGRSVCDWITVDGRKVELLKDEHDTERKVGS
jgi:hypothetical protein